MKKCPYKGLTTLCLAAMLLAAWSAPAWGGWTEAKVVDSGKEASARISGVNRYVVQAGAFESETEAFERAGALREKGYEPHVLAMRGEKGADLRYAVRVSLHSTLADANEARRDVQAKGGVEAQVTLLGSVEPYEGPPLEAETEKSVADLAPEDGLYFLQVGAFIERENALERLQMYEEKGYDPGMVKLHDKDENPWIIVYVGRYDTAEQARDAANAFREKEGRDCYVNLIDRELFESRIEQE